ncbi:capsular polysaccharide biosynthesis protein Cps4B [Streptococcus agalactiae]|uniref:Tyrosine-protein phosphatase n=1 Tax=Streptococcus agalactiae MRI Z1-216 TaxID=1154879 RepID=A0AAD2WXI5_STRAG|nr:capsular polysaccharide biosynthesis protein Cps4B [Streptococcus agalactiae]EPU36687.1 tyrosine protein phosphatase [Streptococcus agalactiae MRI Z1-213]EPU40891.1 tyrosine protein phosphatase [Streptococcus agalactiae MRI Z1-216]EPU40901.1 tyrosine protein phosphatase [Streptococcus agalactiae MRI Z1-214]EPX10920.1 tyrosine protein phosphatase [Streptococcus agalactiae MRI Z1-217]MCC9674282.1 tyrosine protein phosphatase [Streptococcus agalactiae]
MIDIHSHIVFDVDDGPKTLEESLSLIEESYRQGVRIIVATSHRRKGMFETPEDIIFKNFSIVKHEAEKRFEHLQILYGGELYYTSDMLEKLKLKQIPTLNNTKFALIEFSMQTSWKDIHTALSNVLMLGITPVVAHIERYNALENQKERVKEIINMGCYTQINSSHILKQKLFNDKHKRFKKRARYFLKENLVHFVASDMHNLDVRPPFLAEAYKIICRDFGKERANQLFIENAQSILKNHYI